MVERKVQLLKAVAEFQAKLRGVESGEVADLHEAKDTVNRSLFEYLLYGDFYCDRADEYNFLRELIETLRETKSAVLDQIGRLSGDAGGEFFDDFNAKLQGRLTKYVANDNVPGDAEVTNVRSRYNLTGAVGDSDFAKYLFRKMGKIPVVTHEEEKYWERLFTPDIASTTVDPVEGETQSVLKKSLQETPSTSASPVFHISFEYASYVDSSQYGVDKDAVFVEKIKVYDKLLAESLKLLISFNDSVKRGHSYVHVEFGRALSNLRDLSSDEMRDYSFAPVVYLLKFWELEIKTLSDHRTRETGFEMQKHAISEVVEQLSQKDREFKYKTHTTSDGSTQDTKETLLALYRFLYEKYVISANDFAASARSSEAGDAMFKNLQREYIVPLRIVKIISKWENNREHEDEEFLEREISDIADDEVRQRLGVVHRLLENEPIAGTHYLNGYLTGLCYRYLLKKNDTNQERYFVLMDHLTDVCPENKKYFHNNKLSYLVSRYEGESSDSGRIKLEKEILDYGDDEDHYYVPYKISYFHYIKAKSLVEQSSCNIDDIEESLEISVLKQQKAERKYRKRGKYFSSLVPSHDLSMASGVFSYSTFVGYNTEQNRGRLEKLRWDIQALYPKLMDLKSVQTKEQLKKFAIQSVDDHAREYFIQKKKELDQKYEETKSDVLGNIAGITTKVTEMSDKFERKAEDVQTQTLSILSIFVAVALFTVSTVSVFETVEKISAVIAIIVGYASALSLFALAVYAVIGKPIHYGTWKNWFTNTPIGFTLVIIAVILLLTSGYLVLMSEGAIGNDDLRQGSSLDDFDNIQVPVSPVISQPEWSTSTGPSSISIKE